MAGKTNYSPERKAQSVKLVFEEIRPDESRKQACIRLGPKLGINHLTLYSWVKSASPSHPVPAPADSVEALRAENAALKKDNRELSRANEILRAASTFFGAELDRQSKR